MNDTIVALATPSGIGALAVVKISGAHALSITFSLISRTTLTPRHATLSMLRDANGEIIDEVICIYFKAPHSYTAEDVVEIQCHGGVLIARKIIKEVVRLGARIARAGEFTYRAFLHGRIDFTQAEAIAHLINTKNEGARKILARQLKGTLSQYLATVRKKLVEILAYAEVNIDYAEEELPSDLLERLQVELHAVCGNIERVICGADRRLLEGEHLALIGRPNVGKSSLLNAILMQDRSIVSSIAGTTRDTIEESFYLDDHLIKIVDTAGIRDGKDEIECLGINRALTAMKESDVILALFDASEPLQAEDLRIKQLLGELRSSHFIVVLFNKSDLPCVIEDSELLAYPHSFISARNSDIDGVLDIIKEWLDSKEHGEEFLLTSERQREALQGAIGEIHEAQKRLSNGALELFAYHIHETLHKVSSVTHPYEHKELLDVMFGEFCLGK